ncbi:MAG: hypothetical protein HFK10_05585 [Clostridia bacterium]|jgi:cation:H+ antiporter|nr:hypothetical protein [Clostridia bacterium]
MYYALYVLLAAAVVFVSIKLADYVDLLDKKTKISGAVIGGIMLAAVTSLPELFTSITAVTIVRQPGLVIGNILGSNLFNVAALGLVLLLFIRSFHATAVSRYHLVAVAGTLVMFGLVAAAMFADEPKLGWVSMVSPIMLVVYALFIWKMPKVEESGGAEVESPLTVKQIVVRFVIAAVVLIGASIAITYVSDVVAESLELGKTFAGALLLGLTTSLPEVVSTVALCHKKNFNAAFGNIFGSNMFNFMILVVADVLSFTQGATDVFIWDTQSQWLLIFGAAATLVMLTTYLLKSFVKKPSRIVLPITYGVLNAAALSCYILFIALSLL